MTHPGGRPSEYNYDLVLKAQEYLQNLPKDEAIHTIEGLSEYIDIAKSTIYDWIKHDDKKEFSYVVAKIFNRQGKTLLNGGVTNKYNASITKLILVKHNYRDAIDTDVTSKGETINTQDPKAIALAKKYEEEIKQGL